MCELPSGVVLVEEVQGNDWGKVSSSCQVLARTTQCVPLRSDRSQSGLFARDLVRTAIPIAAPLLCAV